MRRIKELIINLAVEHYKKIICGVILITCIGAMFLPDVAMDTDPENMLMKTEPVRIFHNDTKKEFELSEIVVVGIINESHPDGVFNPQTLNHIYELTEFSKTLCWKDKENPRKTTGVIEIDMVAPSLVEHISQVSPGTISFEWLMKKPPETREESLMIRDRALSNPLLKGQMVSNDGKALCIYLPLTDKLLSYKVYTELRKKINDFQGDEEYHITGLPVAEGAIGVEMFTQMGFGSALSMIVIFTLLFLFFRKWVLVILPMIIATVSIIFTMGLMIACGYPVHILSSMLPIFLMSISMVDSVHVLSEFFDVYSKTKGRKNTIKEVMHTLFTPMLYTSLTTAAGFYSLTFAPIPPAQVFGTFLSIGVMVAWIITILFVPAYIIIIPESQLDNFGFLHQQDLKANRLTRFLRFLGRITYKHAKSLLCIFLILIGVAIWGITRIEINDNYAKRFIKRHPIRKADIALNKHFGGTYTAYLALEENKNENNFKTEFEELQSRLQLFLKTLSSRYKNMADKIQEIPSKLADRAKTHSSIKEMIDSIINHIEEKHLETAADEEFEFYQELITFFEIEKERKKIFKRPDVLNYMADLQQYLEKEGIVGKCTSVVDVVRKINQELIDGKPANFKVPDRIEAVAECYMQYQQSHRPHDLWHMVTPDYERANIWLQFPTGDSKNTKKAVKVVEDYFKQNKPPVPLTCRWAGLHYINRVLEQKLVWGFFKSFIGSFLIVFIMMSFLFRSVLWGFLCMIPLSITLLIIYGMTGIIGKDYDLPIAVLSALSIGMAVDFAIHFLERSRIAYKKKGSWKKALPSMFDEPARAISRNVLVIAIGFLPLLVAPLIPYKTTGIMLFGILSASGLITLFVLPAVLTVAQKYFFKKGDNK